MRVAFDWRRLRLGLGLTQAGMAEVLGFAAARSVRRVEEGARGVPPSALARLAIYCTLRGPRERLKRAGVAHPFGTEVAAAVAAWNKSARRAPRGPAQPCAVCALPLGLHPRCRCCPQLLGDPHGQPVAPDGLCRGCRAAARALARRRSA